MTNKNAVMVGGSQWGSNQSASQNQRDLSAYDSGISGTYGEDGAVSVQKPVQISLPVRYLIGAGPSRSQAASFVYFFERADGAVKIGFSGYPLDRFRQIRVQQPDGALRILAIFQGDRQTEKFLHRSFWDCHIFGEWFTKSAEMSEMIQGISDYFRLNFNEDGWTYYQNCLAGKSNDEQPKMLMRRLDATSRKLRRERLKAEKSAVAA